MRHAIFEGLIYNEVGQPAEVVYLGERPFYVILDGDFRRHVEAEYVDRQILKWLHEQILQEKDTVVQAAMSFLGRDDLFTKAMLDSSIAHFDEQFEQLMQIGLPAEARTWLAMLGFHAVVDVHGDVVEIHMPEPPGGEDE
ncbi:MAG: hypothetical protein Kow0047_16540 [Anaerolineae bacterium]